jgi:HK97 family phage portal protein
MIIDQLRNWVASHLAVKNAGSLSDRQAMAEIFQLPPASSGPAVTPASAMQVATVYACITLIAGAVATIPLSFYKRLPNDDREKIKPDVWWLFNEQPSPLMPAAVFWEYIIASICLHGDGFALMVRGRNGNVTEVLPLSPLSVTVVRNRNSLQYVVDDQYLGRFGVHQDDMLHFFGFGFNGVRSMSVIQWAARQSISSSLGTDQYATNFFANGARPHHVISYPAPVSKEQIEQLRQQWAERRLSPADNRMPMVLASGAKVEVLSITAEDSQLMEQRKFSVSDICRAFGVPPFMVGETEKTSSWGTGVEHMGQGFVTFTLQRTLKRIEQEVNRKIFRTAANYSEFNVAALARGDLKARGEFYRKALGGSEGPGWLTADEIRKLDNYPPIPGGDKLYEPPGANANAKQAA